MEMLLKEKNISSLYHFTQAQNLKSIFQYGVLSRKTLKEKGIFAAINDQYRWDNCLDSVSTSIMFPNYKMFYSLRMQNDSIDWALLEIDARIILDVDCAFNWTNAADDTVSSIPIGKRMDSSAFCELFEDKEGHPKRSTLSIPDFYPTNPQAEVLVFSDIDIKNIVGVYFENKNVADKYLQVIPQGISAVVEPKLFRARSDWNAWK